MNTNRRKRRRKKLRKQIQNKCKPNKCCKNQNNKFKNSIGNNLHWGACLTPQTKLLFLVHNCVLHAFPLKWTTYISFAKFEISSLWSNRFRYARTHVVHRRWTQGDSMCFVLYYEPQLLRIVKLWYSCVSFEHLLSSFVLSIAHKMWKISWFFCKSQMFLNWKKNGKIRENGEWHWKSKQKSLLNKHTHTHTVRPTHSKTWRIEDFPRICALYHSPNEIRLDNETWHLKQQKTLPTKHITCNPIYWLNWLDICI